jgi:hypothetical protein
MSIRVARASSRDKVRRDLRYACSVPGFVIGPAFRLAMKRTRQRAIRSRLGPNISGRARVVCPYGPRDRAEWNHCQPTSVKIILAENPLRETVSSAGPLDLESMFEAGNSMIEDIRERSRFTHADTHTGSCC